MRGVYRASGLVSMSRRGSSPHARGLHHLTIPIEACIGIIPACAGFTTIRAGEQFAGPDHPRMRGVYSSTATSTVFLAGSSPHARGLPFLRSIT